MLSNSAKVASNLDQITLGMPVVSLMASKLGRLGWPAG